MKIFEEETDKLSLLDKIFAFLPLIMIIIYAMREHRLKYRHQGAGNGFLRQTTPSKHDKTPPTNSQESEAHFIYFDWNCSENKWSFYVVQKPIRSFGPQLVAVKYFKNTKNITFIVILLNCELFCILFFLQRFINFTAFIQFVLIFPVKYEIVD